MKTKGIKKWLTGVLSMVLCLGLTACGFSVGNAGGKDDYMDLFPDRAETLGNAYKTSNVAYDEIHLLIGFTNLYNDNISLSGEAVALGADDAEIGSTYIYTGAIGGGNTVLADINCGDQKPDGRIRWKEITSETDTLTTYVPWEADWTIEDHISDSYLTVNYEFYGAGGQAIVPGEVNFVLLDEQGNVLAKDMTYLGDEVAAGEKYAGSEDIYSDKELLAATKDMAVFATSTK